MGSRLRWSVRSEWCRDLGLALCAGADLIAWMVHRVSWLAVCLGAVGLGLLGWGYWLAFTTGPAADSSD